MKAGFVSLILLASVAMAEDISAPPEFLLSVTPAVRVVSAGATANFSISVKSAATFSGAVTMAVNGLPSVGATDTFTPASITGAGTSTLAIVTSSTTAPGIYPLTITGTSDTFSFSAHAWLFVTAPAKPGFLLDVEPEIQLIQAGSAANYKVEVTPVGGFTDSVSLSAAGLPKGATAMFTPSTLTGGSSQLEIQTSTTTPTGLDTITIQGVSHSITETRTARLAVIPPAVPGFALSVHFQGVKNSGTNLLFTYAVDVAALHAFTGTVTLSATGLPSSATATFTSPSITAPGSSVLTVTVSKSALTAALQTFKVTGTSGTDTHSVIVPLAPLPGR